MKYIYVIGVVVALGCAASAWVFFTRTEDTPLEKEQEALAPVAEVPDFSREIPEGYKEYRNGRFGFSVLVPAELKATERMESATSHSIVFENADGLGFQIFIVAYADTEITEERFKMDAPSGKRENVQNASIDGVQAVSFESESVGIGETQELWFIKNGYLFEVTTYKPLAQDLFTIMQTWKFVR